jgi:hypothetical protein
VAETGTPPGNKPREAASGWTPVPRRLFRRGDPEVDQLKAHEKLVLVVLRSHYGPKGIFPAYETIAQEAGFSVSSARRAIASLSGRDNKRKLMQVWISIEYCLEVGGSNHYTILHSMFEEVDRQANQQGGVAHREQGGARGDRSGLPTGSTEQSLSYRPYVSSPPLRGPDSERAMGDIEKLPKGPRCSWPREVWLAEKARRERAWRDAGKDKDGRPETPRGPEGAA